MSKIIYTSLIKLPQNVETTNEGLELILKFVEVPDTLRSVPTEFILINNDHINIIRHFENINEYTDWIFSDDRNLADKILIENGFYLYTKQAHL